MAGWRQDTQLNLNSKIFENKKIEFIIRISLGFMFVFASYHKILNPADFAKIVAGYQLFPPYTVNMIAVFLPFIECTTGVALILGTYPRSAALIAAVMLLAFLVAILINVIKGVEFDCGCFANGTLSGKNTVLFLLIRDLFFLFCTLPVMLFRNNRMFCLTRNI